MLDVVYTTVLFLFLSSNAYNVSMKEVGQVL